MTNRKNENTFTCIIQSYRASALVQDVTKQRLTQEKTKPRA